VVKSSRSVSHLLMIFLYSTNEGHRVAVLDDFRLLSTGTRRYSCIESSFEFIEFLLDDILR